MKKLCIFILKTLLIIDNSNATSTNWKKLEHLTDTTISPKSTRVFNPSTQRPTSPKLTTAYVCPYTYPVITRINFSFFFTPHTGCLPISFLPFIVSFVSLSVNEYSNLNLTCKVRSQDKTTITIEKVLDPVTLSKSSLPSSIKKNYKSVQVFDQAFLQILKTKVEDAGFYKCIVKNPWGSDRLFASLIINYLPKVHIINYSPYVTEKVIITCIVEAVPWPTLEWVKDKKVIFRKIGLIHKVISNLVIKGISIGNFTCRGTNTIGLRTLTVNVIRYGALPIPSVYFHNRTTFKALFSILFKPLKNHEPIKNIEVAFWPVNVSVSAQKSGTKKLTLPISNNFKYFIYSLDPFKVYEFQACLVSKFRKGKCSNLIQIPEMSFQLPPKPILIFEDPSNQLDYEKKKLLQINLKKELIIEWKTLNEELFGIDRYYYNLSIMKYIIGKPQLFEFVEEKIIPKGVNKVWITKLAINTCYQLKFASHNLKGYSEPTIVDMTTSTLASCKASKQIITEEETDHKKIIHHVIETRTNWWLIIFLTVIFLSFQIFFYLRLKVQVQSQSESLEKK